MTYILVTSKSGMCLVRVESVPNVGDTFEIKEAMLEMVLSGKESMAGTYNVVDRVSDVDTKNEQYGTVPSFWIVKVRNN